MKLASSNPVRHTQKMKTRMRALIEHLRGDVGKVAEPKAQALFETSAEVLTGLVKAFTDYEEKREAAWRVEGNGARSKTQRPKKQRD